MIAELQKESELLQRLSESATLAMARKSRELAAKGVHVVNLSLGEPDFETPDFIKAAAKDGIDKNFTHYMPVNGYEDFRKAIAHKFQRDNNIAYTPEQIVVSTGAKQSIINVILSVVNPGEEVILPAPYWVSYIEMVKMAGAVPVVIPTSIENDYKFTPEELAAYITPRTRMMIYSSPCNPSGTVFSESEIRALAAVVETNPRMLVISDEIYEHINYEGANFSMGSIPSVYEQVITVNGVAKGWAMTGWRIGYIGAPLWIAKACTKLQGQFTSGASSIAQRASKVAVEADPSETHLMRDTFLRRRGFMAALLGEIPGLDCNLPAGAFYMFPRISNFFGKSHGDTLIKNADDLAEYLLGEGHVATVSGAAFGSPECIRLSYAAADADLTEAVKRITAALAKLK